MPRITSIAASVIIIAAVSFMEYFYGLTGEDVTAALSPHEFYFGQMSVYKITARCPADTEIYVPDMRDAPAGVTVIKDGSSEAYFLWRKRREAWWSFTVDKMGSYTIPSVAVTFTDSAGTKHELKTDSATVCVKSVTGLNDVNVYKTRIDGGAAPGGIAGKGAREPSRSVDGPIRIKIEDENSPLSIFDHKKFLIYAGIGAIALFVAYIAFLVLSRRPPKKVYVPPGQVFLARLGELEKKLSPIQGDMRESYYELSSSLREYLKNVLGLLVQEPTTKEFIELIDKTSDIEDGSKAICRELLTACDAVKYSAQPDPDSVKLVHCIGTARRLAGVEPVAQNEREVA